MSPARYLLYLPAGTLAEMRPFRRWVAGQPTCPVFLANPGIPEPSSDLVEFHTSLRWEYLRDTFLRLLRHQVPYQFVVNLPHGLTLAGGIRSLSMTEAGLAGQGVTWVDSAPVSAQGWREAWQRGGKRFALFDVLAGSLVPQRTPAPPAPERSARTLIPLGNKSLY